jgi:hypothetical protein
MQPIERDTVTAGEALFSEADVKRGTKFVNLNPDDLACRI